VTSQGYLTSSALTPYAPLAGATFTGLVGTVASTTATAGLNVPHGVAPTSPVNGDIWSTTTALFARINASTKQLMTLSDTQTVSGSITFSNASQTLGSSTATGTINVASGATISGSTKTLNIGTGGVSGSTTTTTVGPVLGASTTTIGATTAASTLNLATGATLTATTKAVNIGTNGVSGSTTNIAIGSTTGTSTTTLQGTTNGVTAAVDTNTTQIATTAYVVGQGYAKLASPTFSGTPSLPTGTTAITQTAGNNTTALATTAFVTAAVPAFATNAQAKSATSITVAMTPMANRWATNSQNVVKPFRANFTSTITGTITGYNSQISSWFRLGTAAACSLKNRNYGSTQTDQTYFFETKNNPASYQNFSKPRLLSGRTFLNAFPTIASATMVTWAFYHGKAEGDSLGDLTRRGMGWKYTGGTAPQYIVFQIHDGTTLTNITTTYSPTTLVGFDWDIESDGAGNAVMYINGSAVATATGTAPTGAVSLTPTIWQEEFVASSAPPGNCDACHSRGTITIID